MENAFGILIKTAMLHLFENTTIIAGECDQYFFFLTDQGVILQVMQMLEAILQVYQAKEEVPTKVLSK